MEYRVQELYRIRNSVLRELGDLEEKRRAARDAVEEEKNKIEEGKATSSKLCTFNCRCLVMILLTVEST